MQCSSFSLSFFLFQIIYIIFLLLNAHVCVQSIETAISVRLSCYGEKHTGNITGCSLSAGKLIEPLT